MSDKSKRQVPGGREYQKMATVADEVAAKLKAAFEVRVSCRVARNLLACMYRKEELCMKAEGISGL